MLHLVLFILVLQSDQESYSVLGSFSYKLTDEFGRIEQEESELVSSVLDCESDSEKGQTKNTEKIYLNYGVRILSYSILICMGLLANCHVMSVLQYFKASPLKSVLRAEVAAQIGYLLFMIPLYPLSYAADKIEFFSGYKVAKPYLAPFFQTMCDTAFVLIIWLLMWAVRIRKILVVHHETHKAERCTTKSTKDELRFLTCIFIIASLPKLFDSEASAISDPCKPGAMVVIRKPTKFGSHFAYILGYKVITTSLFYYAIPFIWIAVLTYQTHKVLKKSELPINETKQSVMRGRILTADGITTELDWRILLMYCLLLPGAAYSISMNVRYIIPKDQMAAHALTIDVVDSVTVLLNILHAAFSPIIVYSILYKAFKEVAYEKYWSFPVKLKQWYFRYQGQKKEMKLLLKKLSSENKDNNSERTVAETRI